MDPSSSFTIVGALDGSGPNEGSLPFDLGGALYPPRIASNLLDMRRVARRILYSQMFYFNTRAQIEHLEARAGWGSTRNRNFVGGPHLATPVSERGISVGLPALPRRPCVAEIRRQRGCARLYCAARPTRRIATGNPPKFPARRPNVAELGNTRYVGNRPMCRIPTVYPLPGPTTSRFAKRELMSKLRGWIRKPISRKFPINPLSPMWRTCETHWVFPDQFGGAASCRLGLRAS